MKKRIMYLILPIVALILEIIPFGAVLNFMLPSMTEGVPAGRFRELYSYFDLTPFGYGNFAPLITAIITCIVILILVVFCFTGKELSVRIAKNIVFACAVISFGPFVLGPHFLSVTGVIISLSLISEYLLLRRFTKTSNGV